MALRADLDSGDGTETRNMAEEMGGLAAVGADGDNEMSKGKGQLAVVDDPQQEQQQEQGPGDTNRSILRRSLGAVGRGLLWMPPSCRYDPEKPPEFTMGLNMLFSFATTATVGNLYYNQPILYQIADTFDVSYERSSIIATLMQAGYATGIVLLCPIGDVLPRRPMILALVALTMLLWLGLCLTDSFAAFAGLSYICGFTTVTPQLMLPLVGDLAPPHRRAAALAIVVSGLSLGMLVARVVSGLVANYTSWRNVYWFSFGAQAVVLASLFCFMPNYPTKNSLGEEATSRAEPAQQTAPRRGTTALHRVLRFCRVLYGGIVMLLVRQPTLVQACLVVYCLSAVFTSYWTTLSFLLASPPYSYPSFAIGLFGLIGIVIICFGPFYGRFVIDRIVPIVAVLLGNALEITGVGIGVGIGTFSVAGPVIQAIFIDFGNQCSNIALRASIYGLAPKAQNRINAAYMIASFTGQLSGSAAGNRLYAQGGWRYSGALSLGFLGFATLVCLARGPRETGWVGWHGGWSVRKDSRPKKAASAESSGEEGVVSDAVQEKAS